MKLLLWKSIVYDDLTGLIDFGNDILHFISFIGLVNYEPNYKD